MNMVYSKNVRPEREYQKHGGRVLIERQGYVSAKDRIEAIMMAGKRLILTRGEQYDFKPGEEIDEEYNDPTRSKSYDMVDAFRDGIALEERFREVRKRNEEAKKASENAQNRSGDVRKDEVVEKAEK